MVTTTRIPEKIFKGKRERLKVTVSQWRKLSALIPSCQSKPLWLLWLSITFTPICPIPTLHTCTWPLMCLLLIFGSITPTQITFPKNSFYYSPQLPHPFLAVFLFHPKLWWLSLLLFQRKDKPNNRNQYFANYIYPHMLWSEFRE